MRKLLFIVFTILFCCSALSFVACSNGDVEKSQFKIKFTSDKITISPYVEYDVDSFVVHEAGVNYSYDGYYMTSSGGMKEISFDGTKFTVPSNDAVAEINVTAEKDKDIIEELLVIVVQGEGDRIDEGYNELYADEPINKSVNFNPKFIKEGNSSIKVNFRGYYKSYGTQFAAVPGHLITKEDGIYDLDYFDIYKEPNVEEAWKDAVMYFWVYFDKAPEECTNPVLDLGYRLLTRDRTIDLDFGQSPITPINKGSWSLYTVRFKDVGQTKDLYMNYEEYFNPHTYENSFDQLNFKCRLKDSLYETGMKSYSYTFYFDGINITTYEKFNEEFPNYDWGSDFGNTWENKLSIDNWKDSGEGMAVDFSLKDSIVGNNVFALFDKDWNRLSDYITLDFENVVASCGNLIKIADNNYRYELMMSDVSFNQVPEEEPTGNERFSLVYFNEYNNKMYVTEFSTINNYSELLQSQHGYCRK